MELTGMELHEKEDKDEKHIVDYEEPKDNRCLLTLYFKPFRS